MLLTELWWDAVNSCDAGRGGVRGGSLSPPHLLTHALAM